MNTPDSNAKPVEQSLTSRASSLITTSTGPTQAVKVETKNMQIQIALEVMALGGLREDHLWLEVEPEITAGGIQRLIQQKHELLVGWRLVQCPEEFRARIVAEGEADRLRVIRRWNAAVLLALPGVIQSLKEEAARRGGNWGAKAIKNAELGLVVASEMQDAKHPWKTSCRPRGEKQLGVSLETWQRVRYAVAEEDRLPFGL